MTLPLRPGEFRWAGRLCLIVIAAVGVGSWSTGQVAAQDKTYNKPMYKNKRLDWCLTWGTNCGRAVADQFCNRRRFTRAGVFRAEIVGKSAATQSMGSNQVCTGIDACTAFAYLTCEDPIPRERIFPNPVWKGRRLDVCREWGANCGKPAADVFCRMKGFTESLFSWADAQPGYTPTWVIGTDQECRGSFCTGFQEILCK